MIKIMTDSASDYDAAEAQSLGMGFMPLQVRFGEEEFYDGVNLTHTEFFERLVESSELPQTSQANEYRWDEKYREAFESGADELIVITLSSKLSGTYQCAVKAAKKYAGKVFPVDSLNVTVGQRILCQYALRLVEEGNFSAAEIAKELNEKKNKIQLLALLDTLKYLRKGGRISSVSAFAGELLSIKPVVSIVKGEVKLVGKAVGSRKGNNLLNKLVETCGGIDFDMPYAVAYSGLSDEYLKKYLRDSEALWTGKTEQVPSYMIGSTIGTHAGPGAIAVAFFAK